MIERCLQAILGVISEGLPKTSSYHLDQTYLPIEIILVDDGSIDNTPAVLDQMAAERPDIIKVIHKENGGSLG